MKRTWIGAALLAVLLTVGLVFGSVMDRGLCPSGEKLRRAEELAMAENWEEAVDLTQEVRRDWESLRWLTSALSPHADLEQIEAGFAQLETYAAAGDRVAYGALCAALAEQIEAAGKSHGCTLENFF